MRFRVNNRKISYLRNLIAEWNRKNRSSLRFFLLFSIYISFFLLFFNMSEEFKSMLNVLSIKEAKITSWILRLFSIKVQSVNSIIFCSPEFAIKIAPGCTAIKQLGFYIAGVLAYKCTLMHKFIGIVLGIVIISFTNFIRLISLFLIGIYARPQFNIFHEVFWEILMILIVFFTWLLCINRIRQIETQ